jgi:hypothetical protein
MPAGHLKSTLNRLQNLQDSTPDTSNAFRTSEKHLRQTLSLQDSTQDTLNIFRTSVKHLG